jgi:MFS transporter, DHA1 family, multidrug resistance protein
MWEVVWMTAPIFVLFFCFFPETSSETILRQRAQRLRKLTGRTDIRAKSEIDQADRTFSATFLDAIIKPMEITIKDPAIFFTNTYTSLTYGIYYSFFEAFPLVYPDIYGFNLGELGLTFLTIGVACVIGVTIFVLYQTWYLIPDIQRTGLRAPEHRLVPALFAVITLPIGYFIFGKCQPFDAPLDGTSDSHSLYKAGRLAPLFIGSCLSWG